MEPANYTMKPFVKGDTWDGVSSIVINFTGGATSSLDSGRIQFRKEKARGGNALYEINTASSGILIVDTGSVAWEVSIPSQSLPLPAGISYWDLETIDSNGVIKTYLEGTISGAQDVTR